MTTKRWTALALMVAGLASGCTPEKTPSEAPEVASRRTFTEAQRQACLHYYRDYVQRRRNRYCNPAHDLGFFVDGVYQGPPSGTPEQTP